MEVRKKLKSFNLYHLFLICILILISCITAPTVLFAQLLPGEAEAKLTNAEKFLLKNKLNDAQREISLGLKSTKDDATLSYYYAFQTRIYVHFDSVLLAKRTSDSSWIYASKTNNPAAKANALLSKGIVNNYLGNLDEVVKDVQEGLTLLSDNDKAASTKAFLFYLLYSVYSNWSQTEKMEINVLQSLKFAQLANNKNILVNAYNGLSSTYLIKYENEKKQVFLDSSLFYLKKSWETYQKTPDEVSISTFIITSINIANHYLQYSDKPLSERKREAYKYLDEAEMIAQKEKTVSDWLASIYGLKGNVAVQEHNYPAAQDLFLKSVEILNRTNTPNFSLKYTAYKELVSLSIRINDFQRAVGYQQNAEEVLLKLFDEQQRLNIQKLELQYETQKKNKEMQMLKTTADLRAKQNYLYIGISVALLAAMIFMFRSYHFRLRYSIAREKKLEKENEEAGLLAKLKEEENLRISLEKKEALRQSEMQVRLEREEQARLKAEQQLMQIQQEQLKKEVMANALQIEHKNQMLFGLKEKIGKGESINLNRIINEEIIIDKDFEEIKMQIQKVHPEFFSALSEKSRQRLTDLDLKYCAFIYLKMSTAQIAQMMHVETQSVRMSKYRIKQKLGLAKEDDLSKFIKNTG